MLNRHKLLAIEDENNEEFKFEIGEERDRPVHTNREIANHLTYYELRIELKEIKNVEKAEEI